MAFRAIKLEARQLGNCKLILISWRLCLSFQAKLKQFTWAYVQKIHRGDSFNLNHLNANMWVWKSFYWFHTTTNIFLFSNITSIFCSKIRWICGKIIVAHFIRFNCYAKCSLSFLVNSLWFSILITWLVELVFTIGPTRKAWFFLRRRKFFNHIFKQNTWELAKLSRLFVRDIWVNINRSNSSSHSNE